MARTPTTRRGRETQSRVVAAATALIRANGVAATSLEAVEEASGVGRSQLYHYFDGREDLLRTVAAATARPIIDRTAELLADLSTVDAIERWFTTAIEANVATSGAGGCPIGSLVSQLAEQDEGSREVLADAFTQWRQPLLDGLSTMQSTGRLRQNVDVTALADQVMAAMQGGLLLSQVNRNPTPLRHALAGATQLLHAALP